MSEIKRIRREKNPAKPQDLAEMAKAAAQVDTSNETDSDPAKVTWPERAAKPAKISGAKASNFTLPFSTKVNPDTIAEFDQIVDENGMKKVFALDKALKMWIKHMREQE